MRKHSIMLFVGLAAMLTLALATTTAYALRSLTFSPAGGISASGALTFTGEERELGRGVICNVTLLRTISTFSPKTFPILTGRVTGVAIELPLCRIGSSLTRVDDIRVLRESTGRLETRSRCVNVTSEVMLCDTTGGESRLWKLILTAFGGTLPSISLLAVEIERIQFKLDLTAVLGIDLRCLYQGTARMELAVVPETGVLRRGRSLENLLALHDGLTGGCPRNSILRGELVASPAQTIRLI